MLKRINVRDLRIGMFVHEFCGSWMDHPFWRAQFKITDPQDIGRLHASSIQEVWIDTSKGLDIEGGKGQAETDAEVAEILARAEIAHDIAQPVGIEQEMARARKTVSKAKAAVTAMFHEVRMGKALDTSVALPLVKEISDSVMRNPGAIISIARLKNKDEYTYMHSVAVCALMVALARQLGLDMTATRKAGLAGLLHDVGKMTIPQSILNKNGKLTDTEFCVVRTHPVEGHKMLLEAKGVDEAALDVCLHHHEKVDGSGYPEGLKGDEISLFAKMGAVCDVYDAITSNRPYKSGWDPAESIRRMTEWSKGHFDAAVFQAFVKCVGIYPIGSLVRLKSERIGIVVEQTDKSFLTPKVKVFYSVKSQARIPVESIDLSNAHVRDNIIAREDPAKWNFSNLSELWSGAELSA